MKKLSLCFALICFISFRVAADCYMFLGGNYSATLKTEGAPVHAGGVNYSVLFDWGRFRGLDLGGVYLRYGAEVEACAVSAMIYNYRPAGKSYGMDDGAVSVFGQLMASPFVSLGWRL